AANLASFKGLRVLSGDGTEPEEAAVLIKDAVAHARGGEGPCLLRLAVPRLEGHSYQDTQAYKPKAVVDSEWARDPVPKLRKLFDERDWNQLAAEAEATADDARVRAEARETADPAGIARHVFFDGETLQAKGGQWAQGYAPTPSSD